tara:strand:+ start:162 stop:758 length:597 start_codon:yes stop_codon:yes gene_type:complete
MNTKCVRQLREKKLKRFSLGSVYRKRKMESVMTSCINAVLYAPEHNKQLQEEDELQHVKVVDRNYLMRSGFATSKGDAIGDCKKQAIISFTKYKFDKHDVLCNKVKFMQLIIKTKYDGIINHFVVYVMINNKWYCEANGSGMEKRILLHKYKKRNNIIKERDVTDIITISRTELGVWNIHTNFDSLLTQKKLKEMSLD